MEVLSTSYRSGQKLFPIFVARLMCTVFKKGRRIRGLGAESLILLETAGLEPNLKGKASLVRNHGQHK